MHVSLTFMLSFNKMHIHCIKAEHLAEADRFHNNQGSTDFDFTKLKR